MEFDCVDIPVRPEANQDIQEKDLSYNVTVFKSDFINLYSN